MRMCATCNNCKHENGKYYCPNEMTGKWKEVEKDCVCAFYDESKPTAKADTGKPRISLVPPAVITAIARIREYGVEKYKDPDNWRKVEIGRYHDAFLRHVVACMGDMNAVDEESGLPHLHHAACNLAFMIEIMEEKKNGE